MNKKAIVPPRVWLLLLVGLIMPISGCERAQPWNVLLITFDTTRADRLGSYGNRRIETPTLDRLAAEGVRFANAMSAAPITAPSHTTILTGRYPTAHGFRDNGLFVLTDDQLTLAEILRERGYVTAAAVGSYPLIARFGFDQGFDLFDDHLTGGVEDYLGQRAVPKQRLFFDERRAAQVNEAVLPWLNEHASDPFFLWVHYFDPHQPFEPPPPYDQLYADDLYNGEIAYADSRLGFLLEHLENLGVLDRTLVVMTADHGEGLGEHNEITHAVLAYNSTIWVPLIIRPPAAAAAAGKVVEQRVGTVDIVPTVLDLLAIEPPENTGIQGRSLRPLWQGETADIPQYYAENLSPHLTHGWGELRVLFDGALKYIHGPKPELYDLTADPGELHNLAVERPGDALRMRRELSFFLDEHSAADVSTTQSVDEEVLQRLRSLGYLHSSNSGGEEIIEQLHDGGIAPQERVGDLNRMSAAKHLLFKGRYAEALTYTEKLVSSSTNSPVYLDLHATALAGAGRFDEAWEMGERLLEQGAISEFLVLHLTAQRFERGEKPLAIDFLQRYADGSPSARAYWLLASFHDQLGEPDRVLAALKNAVAINPDYMPARVDLAVHFAKTGDRIAAEREFLYALEGSPYYPKASYNYGAFVLEEGRLAEAGAYFRRALKLSPGYLKAYLALVAVHLAAGERQEAEAVGGELRRIAPLSDEAAAAVALLAMMRPDQ